ncbi:peptide-methionine (S)-S-oxide reductase MsrA [Marivibrio halodurans]|uniref:Peptide methionine sulfoxide reductase MsrA n=1 Tax=Marivibrio halodurans TaxID=2039722 RepID=A0A8J7RY21_9PROT|nr:peptide-methionine (S)-S-oxide reductase MsrA [Marivibrio halodurans]MBP5856495.1 peptide-methionine (S)-S-oxide reductase MsrA [Marivibrio halodurans]
MWFLKDSTKLTMPTPEEALEGRAQAIPTLERHRVTGKALKPPFPEGTESVLFAMGCFWGAERLFWTQPGVHVTAVGYAGGHTPNPTYEETCTGRTGHTEAVLVVHDPARISFATLLKIFWEGHDPTQGSRQGNDVGTQYRSAIYTTTAAQEHMALESRDAYAKALGRHRQGAITTEIARDRTFYYAEAAHQQYLAANPMGYCGLGGTGVACPMPAADRDGTESPAAE